MTDFMDSSQEKIAKEIIAARRDIWLLWTLSERGVVSLRGIFSKQHYANAYRKAVKYHPGIVKVWIEKTISNHLYGEASFEIAYGNGPVVFKDFEKIKNAD